MRFRGLTGFRDFFPEEMAVRRAIEDAWHQASRAGGFEEWEGPVLESLELFTAKSGEAIVEEIYAFEDKGGRKVALRPELTPGLVRMVAARAGGLPKPIKWYCVGQNFRYERPQRGRGREHYQWNADVIGSESPAADAEVISIALDGLRLLGLGPEDVRVRISDRRVLGRVLDGLEIADEVRGECTACIDKLARDPKARARLEELIGRGAAQEVFTCCERYPLDRGDELAAVLASCEDLGIAEFMEPDFAIVRGLAYYTGPVWEIFDVAGDLRAVAGGGRYDHLIGQLGGPDLPACGFGFGDMVLRELLAEKGRLPTAPPRLDVLVLPIGDDMTANARRVVARLRRSGVAAEAPYVPIKLSKGLKLADQSGARRAVLVGPDEWFEGKVRVKDLASGDESLVAVEELE